MNDAFYIVGVSRTSRDARYISIWHPDNSGHCFALSEAGKYDRRNVCEHLDYYHSGETIAVPCGVLDAIAVPTIPGHHDNDSGPCVENNRQNWQKIQDAIVWPTKHPASPSFPGSEHAKPLFIPLKREYYEAFVNGSKTEEFRPAGGRWNPRTCSIGRQVTLSLGYGKANRATGVVTGYRESPDPTHTEAWVNCYGDRSGLAACIRITLDDAR